MINKKTVVIGASTNRSRMSNLAVTRLVENGHDVVPIGVREGEIQGIPIVLEKVSVEAVDTVTLYVNPNILEEYESYILSLNPRRVIFNPGTEHHRMMNTFRENGIQVDASCTLVMLSSKTY